jgi:hypothetical protein
MNFETLIVFKKERFAIEREIDSGKYCVSFPVFNGIVEYSEYYEITDAEFSVFKVDLQFLQQFVSRCKNREEDQRLMGKSGPIRGEPC